MTQRTMCIWFPNWPIQRLVGVRPELIGNQESHAVACNRFCRARVSALALVLYEIVRGTRRVAACSAEASMLGIRVGMPLAEATALAEPVAGKRGVSRAGPTRDRATTERARLHVEELDRGADRQALGQLAEWCQQFSPVVGLEDVPWPECLLMDMTGLESLLGSEPEMGARVERELAERGLDARLAIADTVGAAWAAARYHPATGGRGLLRETDGSKRTGRPRSGFQRAGHARSDSQRAEQARCDSRRVGHARCDASRGRSFVIVPWGETGAAIEPLPIESLRLPVETVDLLHQLGVYRGEQLAQLPREDLTSRFGPQLLIRWDQAMGLLPEPIEMQPLPAELLVQEAIEYPTGCREAVERRIEQLMEHLEKRLIRCDRGAVRLRCRLDCQPGGPAECSLGLFQPTATAKRLFALVQMHLERLTLPGPVAAISIEAVVTAPIPRRQGELFSQESRDRSGDLAELVDRLSSRLGARAVLRARRSADAQPELAWFYEPLVDHFPWKGRRGATRAPKRAWPRPLCLIPSPLPIAAMSVGPHGPPLQIGWGDQQHRVARLWGPERIETGWWRDRGIARDYYRVETATGQRFWLFRQRSDNQWFLHGKFE